MPTLYTEGRKIPGFLKGHGIFDYMRRRKGDQPHGSGEKPTRRTAAAAERRRVAAAAKAQSAAEEATAKTAARELAEARTSARALALFEHAEIRDHNR